MVCVGIAAVIARVASLLSQVALGWLLSDEDYGLFAAATALAGVVALLHGGGIPRILVQEGARYAQIARPYFRIALGFNLASAFIVLLLGLGASFLKASPSLAWMMAIIAIAAPLGTPGIIYGCKLSIDLRFREAALVQSIVAIARFGSAPLFALLGMGAYSLALPQVVAAAANWWLARRAVGEPLPPGLPASRALLRVAFSRSRWLMTGNLANVLILQGDCLALSWIITQRALGLYYFGFHLTRAVFILFEAGVLSVMMPAYATVASDPPRLRAAYLRGIRLMALAGAPVCVGFGLVAEPAVRLLWAGKWDASVPVTQVFAYSLLSMVFWPLAMAACEAMGRWRLRAVLKTIHGVGATAAAAVAAVVSGDLLTIAVSVAVVHTLASALQVWWVGRQFGATAVELLRAALPSTMASLAAGAAALAIVEGALGWREPLAQGAGLGVAFTLAFAVLTATALRAPAADLLRLVLHGRGHARERPPHEEPGA
ncbi:MAG TPA: oligosaccharide flippase family protein [Chthonomonadales bacterium]|nr:oligosaccharide flippase family protein [Chthonomonadales bacterium]